MNASQLLRLALLVIFSSCALPRQVMSQNEVMVIDPRKPVQGKMRYLTPLAPYPYIARSHNTEGEGAVRASFDEHGNVTSAVMTRSTGSGLLDDNTTKWVK